MTREEKVARARELREQGWSYGAIAKELGVDKSTPVKWLNPEKAREWNRLSESRPARKVAKRQWDQDHRATCPECGAPLGVGSASPCKRPDLCRSCRDRHVKEQTHARFRLVADMWNAGASLRDIASALGYGPHSNPGSDIERARAAGYSLPYRNKRQQPKHPAQVAA